MILSEVPKLRSEKSNGSNKEIESAPMKYEKVVPMNSSFLIKNR